MALGIGYIAGQVEGWGVEDGNSLAAQQLSECAFAQAGNFGGLAKR
jgi:hypothetical protein